MPKGIVGRKLGMTQVFDPETGAVTSVTVIAAGPCPVVQVKTNELDGYEAVQLAFDAVPELRLGEPVLANLAVRDLDGVVAVDVGLLDRDHRTGAGLDHGDRGHLPGLLVEDLGHAKFFPDYSLHSVSRNRELVGKKLRKLCQRVLAHAIFSWCLFLIELFSKKFIA